MTTGMGCRSAGLAALVALGWGCGIGEDPAADEGRGREVLDNGAVRVVHTELEPAESWALVEEWRVGSADGPDAFGSVAGLALDAEGALLVLDRQAGSIHRFTAPGRPATRVAGPGSGPGELARPNGMRVDRAARLWVNDLGNARVQWFDSLRPAGTMPVPLQHMEMPTLSFRQWLGGPSYDGRVWDVGTRSADGGAPLDPGLVEWTIEAALKAAPVPGASPAGPDSIHLGSYRNRSLGFPRGLAAPPFEPSYLVAFDPAGFVWTAHGAEPSVVRRSLAGDTLLVVELALEARPVAPAEAQDAVARLERFMETAGPIAVDFADLVPRSHPPLDQLFVDDASRVWVRTRSVDGFAYHVVDAEGELVARATPSFPVSERFIPTVQQGRFLTVVEDAMGVQAAALATVVGN